MPQDYSQILELLLQGAKPDPQGAAYAQAFMGGRIPGDQGVALQTMLSMLSPGAMAERRAAMPGLGELLGLQESEENALTRQAVGLELTPEQEATLGLQRKQVLAQILNNMSNLALEQRKVAATEKTAESSVLRAETEAERTKQAGEVSDAQIAHLNALTEAAKQLGLQREQSRTARQLVLAGVDAAGNPLTPEQKQALTVVAGLNMTNPGVLTLARSMLNSGVAADRKFAADLIARETGLDTSTLEDPVGFWNALFEAVGGVFGRTPTMEELGIPSGPTAGVSPDEMQILEQKKQETLDALISALEKE